jgi:hypothetical protein
MGFSSTHPRPAALRKRALVKEKKYWRTERTPEKTRVGLGQRLMQYSMRDLGRHTQLAILKKRSPYA